MKSSLRDYQGEDVECILEEFKSVSSTLYVAATGLGKTRIMVEVASRFLPKRTLMLAHRSELISQASNAFAQAGIHCEIEKAELVASTNLFTSAPVVIASVQTMLSGDIDDARMHRFNPKDFALLLYDESHRAVSPGNKRIVDYFVQGNPELKALGVTATPDRADEEALGQIFETVAAERDILWATENGWLVPIAQKMVHIGSLDFSDMRTTAGDLNGADLAAVMEQEETVQGVVQPTLETLFDLEHLALSHLPVFMWHGFFFEKIPKHRAIVFTVSVRQAEMLSDIFNRVLPNSSAWICGKTREQDRVETLQRFAAGGDKHILVNVGVTTEGYDNPAVDMIVMARPTKSRSLFAQMVGRSTRPVPGLVDRWKVANERRAAIESSDKPMAIILDFVGNAGRHKLITTADILGGNITDAAIELAKKKVEKEGKPVMMTQALLDAEEELRLEREQRRLAEEARKAKVVAKTKYTVTIINPFDVLSLEPAVERGWDKGRQLSDKQRAVLKGNSIDPDSLDYPQAKKMIDTIFLRRNKHLCTYKQAKLLKKHGINPVNVSFEKASLLIDRLVKNQWKPLSQDSIQAVLNATKLTPKPKEEHVPF